MDSNADTGLNFTDRLLTCLDCSGEFIFTAGEQLFFFDKQFKNDPKRCKPCKSRRAGASSALGASGPAAAGLARTETRTECSACGVETTVPFKPTQGRPVLCRQCFQVRGAVSSPASHPALASAPRVDTTVETVVQAAFQAAVQASSTPSSSPTSIASPEEVVLVAGMFLPEEQVPCIPVVPPPSPAALPALAHSLSADLSTAEFVAPQPELVPQG